MYTIVNYRPESFTLLLTQLCKNSNRFSSKLGLCLGWKGQLICLEGGRRGEGGMGDPGWMTVIHILIGMFNSNPMITQYLNNNLT